MSGNAERFFRGSAALILSAAAFAAAPITIDYPAEGTLFPPDFAAPTFLWRDGADATAWRIEVAFADGAPAIRVNAAGDRMQVGEIDPRCIAPTNELPKLTPEQAAMHTWKPDDAVWDSIRQHSVKRPATITITGSRGGEPVSSGQVRIRTSKDPVGAPILYRDVPLMPSELERGVIKPLAANALPLIAWRLRNVAEPRSRVLMENLHTCGNCHSVSRDGKTMAMDVDGPANDKGLYAIFPLEKKTSIRNENIVAWSSFRGKLGGNLRVAFMSQLSPDGQYVVTMINDPGAYASEMERRKKPKDLVGNYYVANFKDYGFLQVFYPTRGVLAWYSKETGRLQPLPGADDPRYVHTNATWSPDGKYLVFARGEAKEAYAPGAKMAAYANDPNETQIRYDLYRIPFNGGKGGRAEPVPGASNNGMSNSFPRISPDGKWIVFVQARNGLLMRPDSQLFIVPAKGGPARRMRANTSRMNSYHSFSPNGRWLVFSSKSRSPYTQMYLTHIDKKGEDSPAVLVENSTAANRAVNLPEFVNVPPDGLENIDAPVAEFYRLFDEAAALSQKGQYEAAIPIWQKALELNPDHAELRNNFGAALFDTGKVDEAITHLDKALALDPENAKAHLNLGNALAQKGRLDEAIGHYAKALELKPESAASVHNNLGLALAEKGRLEEAIEHYGKALDLNAEDPQTHNNLGIALARIGKLDEAIPHLVQAAKSSPGSFEFQYNLARVLAAGRRFAEAIAPFEKAVEVSGGRDAGSLEMLAGVYSEVGRFYDAARTAQRALAIAVAQGNTQLAEILRARIAEYEAHR